MDAKNIEYQKFMELINHISEQLKPDNNPIEQFLLTLAKKVTVDFESQFIQRHWCASFRIPDTEVKNLYTILGLEPEQVKKLVLEYLGWPEGQKMIGKEQYNIFILLIMAFAKIHKHKFGKLSLFFILTRLYNSVKSKFFPVGCNPEIFRMIFDNDKLIDPETGKNLAVDKKSLPGKYENPIQMLIKYFVPTLYEKYVIQGWLKHNYDPQYISRLFKQSWARLYQIFKSYSETGLSKKYYRVKELGLHQKSISSKITGSDDEQDLSINLVDTQQSELYYTIQRVVNFILLTHDVEIPKELIDKIYQKTKVKRQFIENLAKHISHPENRSLLEDLLLILLQRFDISHHNLTKFCSEYILDFVDRKLISSKHNHDVELYKQKLLTLANHILANMGYNKSIEEFSKTHRVSLLRAINYIFVYLIQKYICSQKSQE